MCEDREETKIDRDEDPEVEQITEFCAKQLGEGMALPGVVLVVRGVTRGVEIFLIWKVGMKAELGSVIIVEGRNLATIKSPVG